METGFTWAQTEEALLDGRNRLLNGSLVDWQDLLKSERVVVRLGLMQIASSSEAECRNSLRDDCSNVFLQRIIWFGSLAWVGRAEVVFSPTH